MQSLNREDFKYSKILDWNSKNFSFGEQLTRAIDYLEFKALNGNAVKAHEVLQRIVSEGQKLRLYKTYFPDEWARSQASFVRCGTYRYHSERANEFFELVNNNLFPLFQGWNDDPETDFDEFGIFSMNIDFCCSDDEYEYMQTCYVFGLLLFTEYEEIWEFLQTKYKLKEKDFPPINRFAHKNLFDLKKNPRNSLYLNLFEVIDHSTGNPWFDLSNCCQYGETFRWNEKTVDLLSSSYKETDKIFSRMNRLDTLIEANPRKVLLELITLWNEGHL